MFECSFTALLGVVVAGLVLVRFLGKRNNFSYPIVFFPKDKRQNFHAIKKERFQKLVDILYKNHTNRQLTIDFRARKRQYLMVTFQAFF